MSSATFKLKQTTQISFDELKSLRDLGAQFVIYQYLIPRPIFPPISRISSAYFIKPGEKPSKYAFKYNLITLLLGWWGLPFGPSYTIGVLKHNVSGTAISNEIFDNLNETDFKKQIVNIQQASTVFIHPDKNAMKELSKSLNDYLKTNPQFFQNPLVAKYIDTEKPYYVIGLADSDFNQKEKLLKEIYKQFYKHIRFEFVNLDEECDLIQKLKNQGIQINK